MAEALRPNLWAMAVTRKPSPERHAISSRASRLSNSRHRRADAGEALQSTRRLEPRLPAVPPGKDQGSSADRARGAESFRIRSGEGFVQRHQAKKSVPIRSRWTRRAANRRPEDCALQPRRLVWPSARSGVFPLMALAVLLT